MNSESMTNIAFMSIERQCEMLLSSQPGYNCAWLEIMMILCWLEFDKQRSNMHNI